MIEDEFYKYFHYLKSESKNVRYIREAKDFIHCGVNLEYAEVFNYYYFEILNHEGVSELNDLFYLAGESAKFNSFYIGKIICIEIDLDDIENISFYDMDEVNEMLIKEYDILGYQMIIIKKNNNAVQRMKEINKVKEYLNKREK